MGSTTHNTSTSRIVEELDSNEDQDLENSGTSDSHEAENCTAEPEKGTPVPLYVHEQDLESFKRVDIRSALEHYKITASPLQHESQYIHASSAYLHACRSASVTSNYVFHRGAANDRGAENVQGTGSRFEGRRW